MSMRLEMLQVARLAPGLLGEAVELVEAFLQGQLNDDGGFKDREGQSDLYYTVFALDAMISLQVDLPVEKVASYLKSFGAGEGLDFVHLCSLARGWAALKDACEIDDEIAVSLLGRIERYRSADGGYNAISARDDGTAYGAFLAVGAYQDLNREPPSPLGVVQSLKFLETPDSAWANDRKVKAGSTNATAAAVTLLRNLGQPLNPAVGDWLMERHHAQGGFVAAAAVPMPDLLTTATALHALSGLQRDVSSVREDCLDFVDTLWTNEGAFHGQWTDDHLDCEYLFYALLALGHLSVA